MISKIEKIISDESLAIKNIPISDNYFKAIEIIYHHVHQLGGKLVTGGMGKAGQIAHNIATTFCSTGTPSIFVHPSEAQHGDLGVLQKNDVLLLISNSGKTREVSELIQLSKQLYDNIPYILISGNAESVLSRNANAFLHTGSPNEVCPLGLTPTTSTTAMTVIGDILVSLMIEKINFTTTDYAKRHHGGYLGEKTKQIKNTMIGNDLL